METKDKIEAADVNKAPKIIKVAKEDIGKLDVLVCGECHNVFHYVDEFKEHKDSKKCGGTSVIRDSCKNETKSQVWAFVLWKNSQIKKEIDDDNIPTPWSIYQEWCKLDPKEKETWIAAGETIYSFTKVSLSKVQEVKENSQAIKNKIDKANLQLAKLHSDLLEEGEIRPHDSESDVENEIGDKVKNNNVNKKSAVKPKQQDATPLKDTKPVSTPARKALRTGKDENIEEAVVEKILGRRLNHKRKCAEYFIKWENLSESENTWEPKIHLIKCRFLMEEFDNIIDKKKKLAKANSKSVESQLEEMESDHSRPQRTSKQKALSQVKVWCGDISEGDEASGKRKSFSDDGSTDSFEKKIKMEDDSDTTDDEKPSITIRRVAKNQNSVNGVAKKSPESVSSVQRVVRVNQKQLPNLSSGVYIMSKTEGIIKLDSNTSPGGAPLLKVGSKIGQTHIKMVKKDEHSTPKLISPKLQTDKRLSSITPRGRGMTQRKLLSNPPLTKPIAKLNDSGLSDRVPDSKSSNFDDDDDDSDGLEELDFPTDLPLPEPDSPPGEFTLCPLTGRVLGESYEPKEPEDTSADSTSLDTLVKLAAAELPEVDLDPIKNEPVENTEIADVIKAEISEISTLVVPSSSSTITTNSIVSTVTDVEASIKPTAIEKTSILNLDDVLTPSQLPTTESSLLPTSLTNVHVISSSNKPVPAKKLLSTPTTVRQKVTTYQHRPPIHRPTMSKPSPTTTIIHKVSPNRNKLVGPKRFQEPILPLIKRPSNVTTYKPSNITKRIGHTTIYKSEKPSPVTNVKKVLPTLISTQPSPKPTPLPVSSSVINMPLLSVDDDPTPTLQPSSTPQQLSEIQPLPVLETDSEITDLASFNLADSDTPLLITGDDGTIYQVAGQNEEGQTILISEGPDGQQQCVIVSSECSNDEISVLMGDTSLEPEQMEVEQPLTINTQADPDEDCIESEESQVVAQIIKADPPSPGGTRKVVLMLPDGNLMMTNVTAEQYAALELDK